MTSIYAIPEKSGLRDLSAGGEYVALMKGAPERVLETSARALVGNNFEPVTKAIMDQFEEQNSKMASRGLRAMALALRFEGIGPGLSREEVEREMIFLGFVGIYDPSRHRSRHRRADGDWRPSLHCLGDSKTSEYRPRG